MHGAHQVAQNSSTTTFPRRLSQSFRLAVGPCSNWIVVMGAAGVPFAGSACAGRTQNKAVRKNPLARRNERQVARFGKNFILRLEKKFREDDTNGLRRSP